MNFICQLSLLGSGKMLLALFVLDSLLAGTTDATTRKYLEKKLHAKCELQYKIQNVTRKKISKALHVCIVYQSINKYIEIRKFKYAKLFQLISYFGDCRLNFYCSYLHKQCIV